jgi:putative PEP-CTERM system integral membrane protein
VRFEDGQTVHREPRKTADAIWTEGKRFGVVVDRSFSMGRHARELHDELDWIQRTLAPRNVVDVILTSSRSRGEPARLLALALSSSEALSSQLVPYGGMSLAEMLAQADETIGGAPYDALLVLTDDGSLDIAPAAPAAGTPACQAPLWLVHLGGAFPPGYDDGVLARVERTRGGVAASVAEALDRQAALADPGVISADEEGVWVACPASSDLPDESLPAGLTIPSPLDQIAARQLILGRSRLIAGEPGREAAALDQLHALAVKYRVVSSYSSMIVLVDERQKKALAEAEGAADRFERPADPQAAPLSQPPSPFGLAATPEPHEWILIGLAAAALALAARRRGAWRSRA